MTSSKPLSNKPDLKLLNHFLEAYLQGRPFFFSFIRPQEAYLFSKHQHLLKPPILDFGAGDGFFAKTIFGNQKVDIGLDVPHSRVPEAIQSQAYQHLVLYDGLRLPFKSNSIGSVFSNCVLEHLPFLNEDMAEVFRILKPGGYFLTSVMGERWEDYQIGGKIFGNPYKQFLRQNQQHENLLNWQSWQAVFTQVGFKTKKMIGYLSPQAAAYLDTAHYLSAPSLISRKLTGQWVSFPSWYRPLNLHHQLLPTLAHSLATDKHSSAAFFFLLQKP